MDFEDEEFDEEASAMAAAMGFSSFGSHKPPAKKRKFNSATDAFVSGQELEAIDRGGKKGQGSGGNTMPLGKVRQFGVEKQNVGSNEDEIGLDEEEDELEGGTRIIDRPAEAAESYGKKILVFDTTRGQYERPRTDEQGLASGKAFQNRGNNDEIDLDDEDEGDNDGPAYIDTSKAPPIESDPEALEVQARIDALLASIEASADSTTIIPDQEDGREMCPPPQHNLPARPAFADSGSSTGSFRGGRGRQGRGTFSDTASVASSRQSHGERNPRWYEGYYDPNFNDNPWKKLEAEKGIKTMGTWLAPNERPRQNV